MKPEAAALKQNNVDGRQEEGGMETQNKNGADRRKEAQSWIYFSKRDEVMKIYIEASYLGVNWS